MYKISEEIIDKIEDIYVNDKSISLTRISKDLSIPRETIRKRLIKRGIYLRSNNEIADSKSESNAKNLCQIYNKVRSLRKVRKITGYSINYIKKCIKGKVDFPIYPKPLKSGYEKITKEKVRIYAHTVFDGYISHSKGNSYTVGYVNKNPALLKEFKGDVGSVYGLKPTISIKRGITTISYSSKLMYLDILNFDKSIIKENEKYKKIYLRAFFDDEGCVSFNPKKGKFYISGSQHNQKEILFIKDLLDGLGIKNNIYIYQIEISLNKSILEYNKMIGFTQTEKRRKLQNALEYYKQKFEKINNQNIKIKELTEKGLTPNQISKIISMPPSTIRHRVNSGFKMNRYDYSK